MSEIEWFVFFFFLIERSTSLRTINKNREKAQTQDHTKGTRQRALQQKGAAEPPKIFDADEHRRRRNQTSKRLEEGRPSTLKRTASATRRKQRDLVDEEARPSRPYDQLQHRPPSPGRPSHDRSTANAPSSPAPESSTKPLCSRRSAPANSTPRHHGRPEKKRRS